MFWKAVTLFGLALCAQGAPPAISEQMVKQEFGLHGNNGGINHIGSHMPEHHEEYAWAYPSYEFSYSVNDPHTHDHKGQREHRLGDEVKGEYWLLQPDGKKRTVKYHSDKNKGFKAEVHYSEHEQVHEHKHQEEPRIEEVVKPVVEVVEEEPTEKPVENVEPVIVEEIPVAIVEEEEHYEPKHYEPKHHKPIHIEYYVNHKYRKHHHEEHEEHHKPEHVEAEEKRREEERREKERAEKERQEAERREEEKRLEEERREEERREEERREEERREEEKRREEERREEERREEQRREEAAEAARIKEEEERRKHRKPVHIEYFSNIHHPIHNEHHGYEIPHHHYYKRIEVEEHKENKPIHAEEIRAERKHDPHVQLLRMHKPMFRPERGHPRYHRDHRKQKKAE